MKVIKVTKNILKQKMKRFISLSLWKKKSLQKIVDANKKLVKELKDARN